MATKQAGKVKDLKILGPISEAAGILAGIAVLGGKKICKTATSAAEGPTRKPVTKSTQAAAKKKKKKATPKKAAKSPKTKKRKQTKQKKASRSPKRKVAKKKSTRAKAGRKKKTTPKKQTKRRAVQKGSSKEGRPERGKTKESGGSRRPQRRVAFRVNAKATVPLNKPNPQPEVAQAKLHSAAYPEDLTATDSVAKVPGVSLPYMEVEI